MLKCDPSDKFTLLIDSFSCTPIGADTFIEPRSEKTGLRGFRPGPTQTMLYNHRRLLEA